MIRLNFTLTKGIVSESRPGGSGMSLMSILDTDQVREMESNSIEKL
jgi:hypothetical protein